MKLEPRRLAQACGAGLLLLAAGLWIGGATGRVYALVRAAASSPRISPLPGSQAAAPRELVLDGQPARVRRCVAPGALSVEAVRERYEALAKSESSFTAADGSVK